MYFYAHVILQQEGFSPLQRNHFQEETHSDYGQQLNHMWKATPVIASHIS